MKSWCVSQLKSLINKLQEKEITTPVFFDDLSPIDNVEKIDSYDKALAWAIANKRIKNIALTGPYGSGKSSLLKTFEKKHPNYQYLNVSLASFQDDIKEDENGNLLPPASVITREEMHRLIELSILQQIFYRVRISNIPDSRFNRIKSLSRLRIVQLSFFSAAFLISVVLLFFPSFMNRFSWWGGWSNNHKDLTTYIAILLTLPALYKIQTYILRLLNTSRFNKINLSKGEVEFDEKSESSVLNKHLDEILYFFEVTNYNIVVFEDLDRFNDPEIFTKLREINILVNQSLQIGRHIVFIYAIKDDMFKDKTRTKFFDFIIPVIPVINYSNSYEKMVTKFTNADLKLSVTDKFINAITLYIDDMRALKNIFNEFMLYKENLKGIIIVEDKLLAIIVYKNIFPSDFADLHENKGVISKIFEKKSALISRLINEKEKLISDNTIRMVQFKQPLVENVKELRAAYLLEFQRLSPQATGLIINLQKTFSQVQESDADFEAFSKLDNIHITLYTPNRNFGGNIMQQTQTASGISFKVVETNVNAQLTYQDRYSLLEGRSIQEMDKLLLANERLNADIAKIKSSSLKELLADNPVHTNIFEADFTNKKLLVYLIREGYIDETYPSLISYFYEGSLSFKDMSFILNIRNRETLAFDYHLDNFENIVKRLDIEDYGRIQALNIQFVDFLLGAQASYREQIKVLYKMLSNQSFESLKFIDVIAEKGTQKVAFFKQLFKAWPAIWDDISNKLSFAPVIQNQYVMLIIEYADSTDLKLINKSKTLEKYIKSEPSFLNWFNTEEKINKAKEFINLFTIKFYKLAVPDHGNDLFDYIIDGRYYVLTEDMIKLIIRKKGTDESKAEELLTMANYSAVQLSGFEPLMSNVADNLSDYLEAITLLLPANTKDSEADVLKLLNAASVNEDIKNRLITKEDVLITDIRTVPNTLWPWLLVANKMVISWKNLIFYYINKAEMDEITIAYLNQKAVYTVLAQSKSNTDESIEEATHQKFTRAYILENRITDEAYVELANSAGYCYSKGLAFENLSPKKVWALIEERTIRLSSNTFDLVKGHFPELMGLLIEKNIEDYLKSPEGFLLEANDFIYLLKSTEILIGYKTSILPQINDESLNVNVELSNLYAKQILQDSPTFAFTSVTLQILMQHGSLLTRRQIFDKYFNLFSKELLPILLTGLGNDFLLIQPDGSQIELDDDELNISIAKKLKQAGLIQDFKTKKNELKIINLNRRAVDENNT